MKHNYDAVGGVIAERVARTAGRITAKRLLPVAVAAGYTGSARNFRRAVAEAKMQWKRDHHRGRRPGIWAPGDMLVFDWENLVAEIMARFQTRLRGEEPERVGMSTGG